LRTASGRPISSEKKRRWIAGILNMTAEFDDMTNEGVLREVSEADAPESVRAIYREIRELSGVPMVALIFRHIAVYPEILEEIWTSIGPLFRAGRVQEAAWNIAASMRLGKLPLPRLEPGACDEFGPIGPDIESVKNTLDAYNRANPVNLLALLSLMARTRSDAPSVVFQADRDWRPPPAVPGPLPQMISPQTMAPSLRWLINDFGFGDRSKLQPVVPSLFRHLAHWPGYLAALHVSLLPHFRNKSIAKASNDLQIAMASEAAMIARSLPVLKLFRTRPKLFDTVSQFSSGTIPMMTVIGHAMRESLV
jgi:hypothetical protein